MAQPSPGRPRLGPFAGRTFEPAQPCRRFSLCRGITLIVTCRALLFVVLSAPLSWSQPSDWQSGVAQVSAKDKSPGSGFIVAVRSGRAYIVTCAHVVEGDPKPSVTFGAASDERHSATVRHLQGG